MVRYNDHDSTTIVLTAITCSMSLVTIALRLVARTKTKAGLGLDDLFAILATVFYFGFCSVFVLGEPSSFEQYLWDANMVALSCREWISGLRLEHATTHDRNNIAKGLLMNLTSMSPRLD